MENVEYLQGKVNTNFRGVVCFERRVGVGRDEEGLSMPGPRTGGGVMVALTPEEGNTYIAN